MMLVLKNFGDIKTANLVVGGICLAGAVALLVITLRLLVISLGYRKSNTAEKTAWQTQTELQHDVAMHRRLYKRVVYTVYSYTVDGKTYTIHENIPNGSPKHVPGSKQVIYQKNRPERVYFKGFVPSEPFLCGLAAFLSADLFYLVFLFLFR